MGLKSENRLRRRADFLKAYEEGRAVRGRLFSLFIRERGDGATPRVGLTVTKRLGTAVVRNRLRRRLRERMRHALGAIPPGLDVVINAKPDAVDCPSDELARQLIASLRKGQAYRE
ncbi:MAG: ribonuclease P protein component [Candidatus Sumerlaeota bacterium]|nr:ribonuclease P protein component [Candidatus Sumerlaeota bacterium]